MRNAAKIAMLGQPNETSYKSQLDYIVNPNGAYIDTGIKLRSTDIVCLDMFVEVFSQSGVFGARGSFTQLNYSGGLTSSIAFVDCKNSSTETRASVSGSPTGRMQIYCDYDKRTVTLADGTQGKNTTDVSPAFECADTCYLFAINGNPHTTDRFKGRIYTFSVKRDGILIADYIPVLDASGRARMYDRVTRSYPVHYGILTGFAAED